MAKGTEQASVALNLEGNLEDNAKRGADALADLRGRIDGGVASLREMNASLKNLRGESADVVAAKGELKARIQAEQQALTKATLESLKHAKAQDAIGKTGRKLADEKDRLRAKTNAISAAVSTAGGPVAALRDKFSALRDVIGEGGAGGKLALLTLGVAGIVSALVAVTAGVVGAIGAFGRFALGAANAARSAGLLREAAFGGSNAQWGKNFGDQVDALSREVPMARDRINALGLELARNNIGGQTWVDTLHATAQAASAFGDEAGNAIKGFVERGKIWKRFRLEPTEMIGSGVHFQEVAASLAESLKISVAEAKKRLFEGRVTLEQGAAALRSALEKKFAKINLRQMLDLDVMARKLGETFDDLTRGIDLEPALAALKELAGMFSVSKESGAALKQIVSVFGNDMAKGIASSTPLAKQFLWGLILGAQRITIEYLKVRNAIRDFIGPDALKNADLLKSAVTAGKIAVYGLAGAVGGLGLVLAAAALPVAAFLAPFAILYGLYDTVKTALNLDWAYFGRSILDGLVSGITERWTSLKKALSDLGSQIESAFAERLRIHSPSRVFAELGEELPAGVEQGVNRGASRAQGAVERMVGAPGVGGAGSSSAGGASVVVHVHIHAEGGGANVAAQVTTATVLEQLTHAVFDACHQAGIPVPG